MPRQQLLCHKLEAPFQVGHGYKQRLAEFVKSTLLPVFESKLRKRRETIGTTNMCHLSSNPSPFPELRGTDGTDAFGHCRDAVCSILL